MPTPTPPLSWLVVMWGLPKTSSLHSSSLSTKWPTSIKQTNPFAWWGVNNIKNVAEGLGSRGYIRVKKWLNVARLGKFNGGILKRGNILIRVVGKRGLLQSRIQSIFPKALLLSITLFKLRLKCTTNCNLWWMCDACYKWMWLGWVRYIFIGGVRFNI